jgi:hypothetical protein
MLPWLDGGRSPPKYVITRVCPTHPYIIYQTAFRPVPPDLISIETEQENAPVNCSIKILSLGTGSTLHFLSDNVLTCPGAGAIKIYNLQIYFGAG